MQLTGEQKSIISYDGKLLCVKAYAGTGKTSTLREYANRHSGEKMLYIAFNKAIQTEAQRTFPKNVLCKTTHAMAWKAFPQLHKKLQMNISLSTYSRLAETDNWWLVGKIVTGLESFMNSADEHLSEKFFPEMKFPGKALEIASEIWQKQTDPFSDVPCTLNTLLKLFQLSGPDLSRYFGVILFDEAQDANPVTTDIVLKNNCKKIIVGDDHQMINRWRGSENAMKEFEGVADQMRLTNSFRFGEQIAGVANLILSMKGEKVPLQGKGQNGTISSYQELSENAKPFTVLCRTRIGVMNAALSQIMTGRKVAWNGGTVKYNLDEMTDLFWLKNNKKEKIRSRWILRDFDSWESYKEIAESTKSVEMRRVVQYMDKFPDIPEMVRILKENECRPENADVLVSTIHTAKGLEWENVVMGEDHPDFTGMEEEERTDEMNLLYVSATRATRKLSINSSVMQLLEIYRSRKTLGLSVVLE